MSCAHIGVDLNAISERPKHLYLLLRNIVWRRDLLPISTPTSSMTFLDSDTLLPVWAQTILIPSQCQGHHHPHPPPLLALHPPPYHPHNWQILMLDSDILSNK